jgi:hypothetical protein
MNERIEKLAIECYQAPEFDYKKFAELIVKECMKLNHEHFSDEDPYSIDSLYRYHFGVE